MSMNNKVLGIVILMLLSLSLVSIVVFTYSFKNFSIKNSTDKAISIAQNVRDGLTAHMVNGTMDKRALFLNNIAKHQNIDNFHLLRAPSVVEQYGDGFFGETRVSNLEKEVLKTKKLQTRLEESASGVTLKVSIPYISSSYSTPNCISCHISNEGEVLGVISMDIDASNIRAEGMIIAGKIFIIMFIILIISIILASYFIKPYIKLFDDLENGISQAYKGDFSYQIDTTLTNEAGIVANRLNELSEIYKFKKTIELDDNKEMIFSRIVHILQSKFSVNKFILFEINNKTKLREVVFDSADLNDVQLDKNANICRSFRTSSYIYSSDFDDICLNCKQKTSQYLCLNFIINDDYTLILHIQSSSQDEMEKIKVFIPVIKNYFDMAKPVIESRILMEILKETAFRDPLTTLYNRRFLNELLDSNKLSKCNEGCLHSILMVDIDFFKKVNDTYGHDIGDVVIEKLAKVIKESIRDVDIPVRFGGEEFLILLVNSTKEISLIIAEKIRNKFSSITFSATKENFTKTLSIGIANYSDESNSLGNVIKLADESLYIAKNTGRDKIVEFDDK